MIDFQRVTKQFKDGTLALDKVSFTISPAEFVFFVGPSGSGKTTILRLLLREFLPTSGSIFFEKEEINKIPRQKIMLWRRKIGAAFQDYKLLWDRTVKENLSLPLEILKKTTQEIEKRSAEVLKLVGLEKKAAVFPSQLSGGEIQRIVIARALIAEPKILFADEPTGNLDPDTAWQITSLLKKINESGKIVIMATHDATVVNKMDERVIHLDKGKIISDKKKGKYP